MIVDLASSAYQTPTAFMSTIGVSREARMIDNGALEGRIRFFEAYSLDDGRRRVQMELSTCHRECSRRGWDGYNAAPVLEVTVNNAIQVVEALPIGFPMPTVGAEPDGHVTLEWYRTPSRVISLSVSPDGVLHFAALLGAKARQHGTEPFLGSVPKSLLDLIRRVTSG
jgi:hypothetical protein